MDQRGWKFPDGDEFKRLCRTAIRIDARKYRVVTHATPKVGDLVIDRKDGLYGKVDMVIEGEAAVRNGCVAEVGVPLTRLVVIRAEAVN